MANVLVRSAKTGRFMKKSAAKKRPATTEYEHQRRVSSAFLQLARIERRLAHERERKKNMIRRKIRTTLAF